MKRFTTHLFIYTLVGGMLLGCSEPTSTPDENPNTEKPSNLPTLTLELSADQINIDKKERIEFISTLDDKDVSEDENTKIFEVTNPTLPQQIVVKKYTSAIIGEHSFVAQYDYKGQTITSDTVKLNAYTECVESDIFMRRTLIADFTGTWCSSCSDIVKMLDVLKEKRPDRVISMAIHCWETAVSEDRPSKILMTEEGTELFETSSEYLYGNVDQATVPSCIINLDYTTANGNNPKYVFGNGNSSTDIFNLIDHYNENKPLASGLRLAAKVEGGKLKVDVETTVTENGEYKIAVAYLKSGYDFPTASDDYDQNHVLRGLLPLSDGTKYGFYGTSLGELKADDVTSKSFEVAFDDAAAEWGKYEVVAYVLNDLNQDGIFNINNTRSCLIGDDQAYDYELVLPE